MCDMPSIPASPTSPTSNRRSMRLSSFEALHDALHNSSSTGGPMGGTTWSRRSSRTSQTSFMQSPVTPRPMSTRSSRPSSLYNHRKSSSRLSTGSNISLGLDTSAIGNLADELEDALDDEYEDNESGFLDGLREGSIEPLGFHSPGEQNGMSHISTPLSPRSPTAPRRNSRSQTCASPSTSKSNKPDYGRQSTDHKRDASEYRLDSDSEGDGMTPALAKCIRDVESLARMSVNAEDTLSEGGGVVIRTTHALKDLGPQASIETNLSRIISAYTSMATHRTHKTRDFFSQAHSLLRSSVLELPEDVIDALLVNVEALSSTVMFKQQQNPLLPLQILASQTLDLAHTLRSLTDALQESRIQANTATRKLRGVKDMVDDICYEQELVETSIMLIQAGDWDRRCRERRAAATCREVVQGFGDRWGLEPDDRPWMHEHKKVVL